MNPQGKVEKYENLEEITMNETQTESITYYSNKKIEDEHISEVKFGNTGFFNQNAAFLQSKSRIYIINMPHIFCNQKTAK
jgi:hypothetical protein